MRGLLVVLPLVLFVGLALLFLIRLESGGDNSAIPSALIGQKAPATNLPPLEGAGLAGLQDKSFAGKVTLLNVWASWCAPCREEHPVLLDLSKDGRFTVAGLNYKDKAENARRFLGSLGNPFSAIGVDEAGRTAVDWGVYGVPETFIVGKDGRITYKHVGPLSAQVVAETLLPEIDKALAAP